MSSQVMVRDPQPDAGRAIKLSIEAFHKKSLSIPQKYPHPFTLIMSRQVIGMGILTTTIIKCLCLFP